MAGSWGAARTPRTMHAPSRELARREGVIRGTSLPRDVWFRGRGEGGDLLSQTGVRREDSMVAVPVHAWRGIRRASDSLLSWKKAVGHQSILIRE